MQFGQELKVLKDEISHLQDRLSKVLNPVQSSFPIPTLSPISATAHDWNVRVSTWNYRGLQNATRYLRQLIKMSGWSILCEYHLYISS